MTLPLLLILLDGITEFERSSFTFFRIDPQLDPDTTVAHRLSRRTVVSFPLMTFSIDPGATVKSELPYPPIHKDAKYVILSDCTLIPILSPVSVSDL
jgi:hypothetical protein